jgi:undecaprenyl-diphosphatase
VPTPPDDDPLDHLDVNGIITDLEAEFQATVPETGPLPAAVGDHPNAAVPGLPPLTEVLPPIGAHLGQHDLPLPHELTPIERFDQAVDNAFDRLRGTEPADRIFYALTELADFSLLWLLIAASRAAANEKQLPMAVRVGVLLPLESVVVNAGIKSAFKRERPVPDRQRPYKLRVPLTTSFPSGHSSAAMMAAILLSENSRVKPLYWGLAGLVASSRVYVQIHHASDVVGGLAVGVVLGNVAKRAWPLDQGPIGTRRLRARRRR